tara:strand:+ start:796 stop:1185 length:390 start_codon:yes stop_codon:yes gene_type:complete
MVEEATEKKEFLLSDAFHFDESYGTNPEAKQLYCPLGCVVANLSTDQYDDEYFTWHTADIESRIEQMFNDKIYIEYDLAINTNSKCDQYQADEVSPTGDSMYIIPRDIALKHFKTALYKHFNPPTKRES